MSLHVGLHLEMLKSANQLHGNIMAIHVVLSIKLYSHNESNKLKLQIVTFLNIAITWPILI